MQKYVDITRLKDKYMSAFNVGEHITITEKIDGANASITYNKETNELDCFSRRQPLHENQTLNGFWNYVQTLDIELIKDITENGKYIIFGEWLIKHSIKYPEDVINKFYVFDLYDTTTNQYTMWKITYEKAMKANLLIVPLFYDGSFISWDHVNTFLGRSDMNAEPTGEGIVIKSQDRLDNISSKTPSYVKIVTKEFSEVHKSKEHNFDPEKFNREQEILAKVGEIVTKRRIEKLLQKLIEDEIIPSNFDEHNLKEIAQNLPRLAFDDCVKEEPEFVESIDNFGKYCNKLAMQYARELCN
jgi:hypothetical protein